MARGIRRLAGGPGRAAPTPGRSALRRAARRRCRRRCARQALTHSSWVEHRADSYGRLAFLGDSVLGLAIAEHLFRRYPRADIGRLTKMHGQAVSGRACAEVAADARRARAAARDGARAARGRDRRRCAARLRAGAGLGLRGRDRRLLSAPRLRAHRRGDGGGVRRPDRDRVRAVARLQVGAAGAARARRRPRPLRGHRARPGPPHDRVLRGRCQRQRRGRRAGLGPNEEGGGAGGRRAGARGARAVRESRPSAREAVRSRARRRETLRARALTPRCI